MARMLAYVRVSTTKQGDGVSLEQQRKAIIHHANASGLTIIKWYEEKKTASKGGRPEFSNILKSLRKGNADGVIMHKIDRSARNLRDWADLSDLIDRGIKIEFAHDNIDLNTRGGRLSADLQAAIAADYVRNLRDETIKGLYGRLNQGLYPFAAPIGYLNTGKGQVKAVDQAQAPLVVKAFELYATQEYSLRQLQDYFREQGLVRSSGKPLCKNGISNMLRNPFYTGLIRIKRTGATFDGKHTPLISTKLFQAVQRVLDGKVSKKSKKHDFLLSNFIKCAACGYTLSGETQRNHVYFRCHSKSCRGTSIREDRLEELLRHIFSHIAIDKSLALAIQLLAKKKNTIRQSQSENKERELKLELSKIEQRISRLTDILLDKAITNEEYGLKKSDLLTRQKLLKERLDSATKRESDFVDNLSTLLDPCTDLWPKLKSDKNDAKRKIIKKITSNISIDVKKPVIELKKPYSELGFSLPGFECSPFRDNLRTFCPFCDVEKPVEMSKQERIADTLAVLETHHDD